MINSICSLQVIHFESPARQHYQNPHIEIKEIKEKPRDRTLPHLITLKNFFFFNESNTLCKTYSKHLSYPVALRAVCYSVYFFSILLLNLYVAVMKFMFCSFFS